MKLNNWKTFNILFTVSIIAKIYGQVFLPFAASDLGMSYEQVLVPSLISQGIAMVLMAGILGYFGYKYSRKYSYCFLGLLGFFWLAFLGPIIGFSVIYKLRNCSEESPQKSS